MSKTAQSRTPAPARRRYRQGARAEAAQQTAKRILDVFVARLTEGWFDEITLDSVAADAGVAVQTVLRRFGSKEGLMEAARDRLVEEVRIRRKVEAGDVEAAIRQLAADYESTGDLVMRLLMQEDRYTALRPFTDLGRREHRAWLEKVFAPQLQPWSGVERKQRVDMLVAASDLYLWRLIRRDMGRSVADYAMTVRQLIDGALARSRNETRVTELQKEGEKP